VMYAVLVFEDDCELIESGNVWDGVGLDMHISCFAFVMTLMVLEFYFIFCLSCFVLSCIIIRIEFCHDFCSWSCVVCRPSSASQ
jgi:hypothetical protein